MLSFSISIRLQLPRAYSRTIAAAAAKTKKIEASQTHKKEQVVVVRLLFLHLILILLLYSSLFHDRGAACLFVSTSLTSPGTGVVLGADFFEMASLVSGHIFDAHDLTFSSLLLNQVEALCMHTCTNKMEGDQ